MSNTNKFIDRSPHMPCAGVKLQTSDGSIFLPSPRAETPQHIARARAFQSAPVGTRRLNASDVGAEDAVHGVQSDKSQTVSAILSPPPKTFMQHMLESKKDSIYASATKPLGLTATLKGISVPNPDSSFGIKTNYDGSTAECLSANTDSLLPSREPGLQTRRYGEALDRSKVFGKPSPHDDAGRNMSRTLTWVTEAEDAKVTRIRSKIDEDFHARTAPPLGGTAGSALLGTSSPYSPTKPVLPNDSAKEIIYMHTVAVDADTKRNTQHGVVTTIRHKLKKSGFEKFAELETAFRAHDVNGKGTVEHRRVAAISRMYLLPLEENLLDELATICDIDGQVNYVDLVALMDYNRFAHSAIPAPFEIQPMRAGGVPTIRADKAAPRIRRVCDFTNYGDEGDASSLLNPSTMTRHGVHARDLLCPRTQSEVRQLFAHLGVALDDQQFASLWDHASKLTPTGEVSVESFRTVLEASS